MCGFAARRGASIEHSVARLRIEEQTSRCGARILNVAVSRGQRVLRNARQADEILARGDWCGLWIFGEKFITRNLQTVNARINGSGFVVPVAKRLSILETKIFLPAID